MLRQVIAWPSLPMISRLPQPGGPGSCPQASGPLSAARPLSRGLSPGGVPGWPGGGYGEPGLRGEREGDVPVPGDVLADLIMVHRGLVLGSLERDQIRSELGGG